MPSGADLADEITVGGAKAPDANGLNIPFHPLADIFPLLPEVELRALAGDIAAHGLHEPIVMFEGQILDGRCRYLGGKTAKVDLFFEDYIGNDPVAYVLSRNIRRRHLTEAQRAFVAARVANLEVGANQYSAGLPIGRASQLLAVSERSIARAKGIVRGGVPELVRAVESGAVSLFAGASISHMPQQQQLAALQVVSASSVALTDNGSVSASLITTFEGQQDRAPELNHPNVPVFPGWVWNDVIPLSGVTVIVGGAATMLAALKIGTTVCRAWDWPDHSTATSGEILWLAAGKSHAERVRSQIAPKELNHSLYMVAPELDAFGLPIRHFALDLDRLRGQIKRSPGVILVTSRLFYGPCPR